MNKENIENNIKKLHEILDSPMAQFAPEGYNQMIQDKIESNERLLNRIKKIYDQNL